MRGHEAHENVDGSRWRERCFRIRCRSCCIQLIPGTQQYGFDHRVERAETLDQRSRRQADRLRRFREGEARRPPFDDRGHEPIEQCFVGNRLASHHVNYK